MPTEVRPLVLLRIYGKQLNDHNYGTVLPSAAFAGTIVGMLVFGLLSDKIGTSIPASVVLSHLTFSRTEIRKGW